MALSDTIQDDLKTAMKSKDRTRLGTLRMLKSDIKNKEIENGKPLDDDGVLGIICSTVKKRRESIEAYKNGGRDELAAQEEQELAILQSYLPPELSDDQISAVIDEVLATLPEGQPFGPAMGAVMKKLQGSVDGKRVNALLRARMSD